MSDARALGTDALDVLRSTLALSDRDLSALLQGRPVVKTLPASTGREVATAGAIRIRGTIRRFVEQFQTLEGFRRSEFVHQIARFSTPPVLADLDTLVPEAEDLTDLRTCRVGKCAVRLPAADIHRFQTEVDWRVPDWSGAASALFKRTLFGYVAAYRAGGLDRLPRYDDQGDPIAVGEQLRDLIGQSPSPLDTDPALRESLLRYPAGGLVEGANHFFYWSKEEFGFKPIVGLNHVCTHVPPAGGPVTMVTIQFYATHYIDGQVAVMTLLPDPADSGAFYWLYLNRARIGRLSGFWGVLARPIVQGRARSGLSKSFTTTKTRMENQR